MGNIDTKFVYEKVQTDTDEIDYNDLFEDQKKIEELFSDIEVFYNKNKDIISKKTQEFDNKIKTELKIGDRNFKIISSYTDKLPIQPFETCLIVDYYCYVNENGCFFGTRNRSVLKGVFSFECEMLRFSIDHIEKENEKYMKEKINLFVKENPKFKVKDLERMFKKKYNT